MLGSKQRGGGPTADGTCSLHGQKSEPVNQSTIPSIRSSMQSRTMHCLPRPGSLRPHGGTAPHEEKGYLMALSAKLDPYSKELTLIKPQMKSNQHVARGRIPQNQQEAQAPESWEANLTLLSSSIVSRLLLLLVKSRRVAAGRVFCMNGRSGPPTAVTLERHCMSPLLIDGPGMSVTPSMYTYSTP